MPLIGGGGTSLVFTAQPHNADLQPYQGIVPHDGCVVLCGALHNFPDIPERSYYKLMQEKLLNSIRFERTSLALEKWITAMVPQPTEMAFIYSAEYVDLHRYLD